MDEKVTVDAFLDINQVSERGLRETVTSTVEDEDEERRSGTSKNDYEHLPPGNTTAFETTSTVEDEERRSTISKNDCGHLSPGNTTAFEATSTVEDEERRSTISKNDCGHLSPGNTTAFEATSTVEDEERRSTISKNDCGHLSPGNTTAFEATSTVEDEERRSTTSKNDCEHLSPGNTTSFETETMCAESLQPCLPMENMSRRHNEPTPPPDDNTPNIAELTDCLNSLTSQLEYQNLDMVREDRAINYSTKLWKSFLEIMVTSITVVRDQLSRNKNLSVKLCLQQMLHIRNGEFIDLKINWPSFMGKIKETELEGTHLNVQITTLKKLMKELNLKREDMLIQIAEIIQRLKVHWVKFSDKIHEIGLECARLKEIMKPYMDIE